MNIDQKFSDLQDGTVEWALVRGIYNGSSAKDQLLKTDEEFSELAESVYLLNMPLFIDSVGDVLVTLVNALEMFQSGLTVSECLITQARKYGHGKAVTIQDIVEYGQTDLVQCETFSSLDHQMLDLSRLKGRITKAVVKENHDQVVEYVGKFVYRLVCMVSSFAKCDLNAVECFEVAFEEISGRTGKMVNGVFEKDGK